MSKIIPILVREMGELYASEIIHKELNSRVKKHKIEIILIISPYNSDLVCIEREKRYKNQNNISIIGNNNIERIKYETIYGFDTDINGKNDFLIEKKLNIYEILSCSSPITKTITNQQKKGVIGNLRFTSNSSKKLQENFQQEKLQIIEKVKGVIFSIIPRHPIETEFIGGLQSHFPVNSILVNTVGDLKSLYAESDINIMGQIFSEIQRPYDHNPMEATQNSYAIGRKTEKIHQCYEELYDEKSIGLYKTLNDVSYIPSIVKELLQDKEGLSKRLQMKNEWIRENKKKYLQPIIMTFID